MFNDFCGKNQTSIQNIMFLANSFLTYFFFKFTEITTPSSDDYKGSTIWTSKVTDYMSSYAVERSSAT